jgi:hypothetical protein
MSFTRRRWVVVAPLASMLSLTLATTPGSAQIAKEGQKLGTAAGSTTLTASETQALIRRFADCWSAPTQLRDADLKVTVQLKFAKDGSLAEPPKVLNSNPDPRFAVAAKSAIAGVTKCAPFDFLPAAKYAAWREMIIDFDPHEMFGDKPR